MMWTKKYNLLAILFCLVTAAVLAQPADPQTQSVLIVGAHAHLGTGISIENSAIGFRAGKIDFIGTANNVNRANYQKIIEATGNHVYPGFITANSTLGLQEIDAIRASNDLAETGSMNPNVRSIIAYNAESMIIPTSTTNGMLMAQITPRGGVISGTSSVVQLDAWNWEDAVVLEDDGIHLNWPNLTSKTGWYLAPGELKANEGAQKTIQELEDFFTDATSYCLTSKPATMNLRLQAMCQLFDGKKSLYIHANQAKDMSSAIQFAKKHGVKKMVIVGGYESFLITDMLRENKIPVVLNRIYSLPGEPGDDIELPYKLPGILHSQGVKFCFDNDDSHERMMVRNIPFYAGTAVSYGLPYEQAIKSLTLDAASILGIDSSYGSLEVGKSATLFISVGDAIDVVGNQVTTAFIDGRNINLKNRQEQLFERYKEKYSK